MTVVNSFLFFSKTNVYFYLIYDVYSVAYLPTPRDSHSFPYAVLPQTQQIIQLHI